MHLRHHPQTVAQAAGDNVQDTPWLTAGPSGLAVTSEATLLKAPMRTQFGVATRRTKATSLRLSLPRDSIAGFQVHIEEAYGSVAALHIDHLHGAIRGKQRGEQGLGEGQERR